MKTEHAVEDAEDRLNRVKKLLDESTEIRDRIKALKAERAATTSLWLTSPTNDQVWQKELQMQERAAARPVSPFCARILASFVYFGLNRDFKYVLRTLAFIVSTLSLARTNTP